MSNYDNITPKSDKYISRYEKLKIRMEENQELEQKFSVPENYSSILEENGAVKKSEKLLEDEYYDTTNFELLKRDVWLRKRGEKYELKIAPPGEAHKRDIQGMTQYKEVEGKDDVVKELSKIVDTKLDDMTILVKVSASRESWILDDFTIVIDRIIEDGWSVGEIELMAAPGQNMANVKDRIDKLRQQFKFTPLQFGKVRHCLQTQNPVAYTLLSQLSPVT